MNPANLSSYEAAHQAAAFYPLSGSGCLRISGEHRSDFLQRQSTQDIHLLAADRALLSVLTSPTARILDVFYLVYEPEAILALTLPGKAAETANFLKKRIFFMDRVAVEDISSSLVQIDILGPQAAEILQRWAGGPAPDVNQVTLCQPGGIQVQLIGMERSFGLGWRLLAPAEANAALQAGLLQAGASQLRDEEYHVTRVEAGLPALPGELSEDYTPLETGLQAAISDHKGCYTGQEILARQITYDKVTQSLCGLKMEAAAQPGERLWADGRAVGTVTSMAQSPRFGAIALGIIKRPHDQVGTKLAIGDREQDTQSRGAQVARLPFQTA